jgi:hypothetical protein
LKHIDLVNAFEVEFEFIDSSKVEFEDGMEDEEFFVVGDMIYLFHC